MILASDLFNSLACTADDESRKTHCSHQEKYIFLHVLLFCLLINKRIAVRRMNPQTDNVTENHSTNIKIYYLTNSGRRTQINATTGSYQFDAFYSQQTQQYPKDRCGRRSEQTTGSSKRRKEKDSFQFHFRMLMLPFKRMRVYDNHPIYHMRVSKKGNTSQIGNKYQWKEKL